MLRLLLVGLLAFSPSTDAVHLNGQYDEQSILAYDWTSIYPGMTTMATTSQFKMKEDTEDGFLDTKKYTFVLEQSELGHGGVLSFMSGAVMGAVAGDEGAKMIVETQAATLNGNMKVRVGDDGEAFSMFHPHMMGMNVFGKYTWRVTKEGDDEVLFTIQKSHKDVFGSQSSWRIYEGHAGDEKVMYYGVGKKASDVTTGGDIFFRWYKSKWDSEIDGTEEHQDSWVATVALDKREADDDVDGAQNDQYRVHVEPGADAAILLLATTCMDTVLDKKRT